MLQLRFLDHYKLLGVPEDANRTEIRIAFDRAVKSLPHARVDRILAALAGRTAEHYRAAYEERGGGAPALMAWRPRWTAGWSGRWTRKRARTARTRPGCAGRPVGVTVDPGGALLVADDLSNTLWRVTPENRPAADSSSGRRTDGTTVTPRISGQTSRPAESGGSAGRSDGASSAPAR